MSSGKPVNPALSLVQLWTSQMKAGCLRDGCFMLAFAFPVACRTVV